MNLTYASVCSGIEAPSVAWHALGWRPLWFSEIEDFPCKVLAHHYPSVPNLGDMTKLEEMPGLPTPDVFIGGTPCFPAGTLVLTDVGLVPIEDVRVGDRVLTHEHRYQRVLRVGQKRAATWRLRGQGVPEIITTADHPFYARKKERGVRGEPEWTPAQDLRHLFWASPSGFPELPVPPVSVQGRERPLPGEGFASFWWLVGFWLGNGWTRIQKTKGYVLFSDAHETIRAVEERLQVMGVDWTRDAHGTATRLQVCSSAWARWLERHFGRYSDGKRVPAWVLGMVQDDRQQFLAGYLFADGNKASNGDAYTTVNKNIAIGIRLLVQSLGRAVSLCRNVPVGEKVIQGRTVTQQPWYRGTAYDRSRSAFEDDGFWWGCVRKSEPTGAVESVFNLEVEEDNSYTAEGMVVHNCQAFSTAGLRGGLEDARGNLALVFCRLVGKLRPQWVVWENVPGVLSIDGGRAFGSILGGLAEFGYGWSYRVLDAQFVGGCDLHVQERGRGPVPQRRRRVFVVAHSGGDWRLPAEVLALGEGVLRDLAARGAKRKKAPRDAAEGAGERRVAHTLSAEGADAGEDGTGRGTPLVTGTLDANHGNVRAEAAWTGRLVAGTLCSNRKAAGSATLQDAETGLLVPQVAGTLGGASQSGGFRTTDLDNNGAFIPERAGSIVPHGRFTFEVVEQYFERYTDAVGFNPTGSSSGAREGVMPTLKVGSHANAAHQAGVAFNTVGFKPNASTCNAAADIMPTLVSKPAGHQAGVAFSITPDGGQGADLSATPTDTAGAVTVTEFVKGTDRGTRVGMPFDPVQVTHPENRSQPDFGRECHCLAKDNAQRATIVQSLAMRGRDGGSMPELGGEQANALRSASGGSSREMMLDGDNLVVRRLTPLECERLQGFPDWYTAIPVAKPRAVDEDEAEYCAAHGVDARLIVADSARYKALGNSMAVPCIRLLGVGIERAMSGVDGRVLAGPQTEE